MKIQKLVTGVVLSTVVLFLLDWAWYGILMKDSMSNPNARPEPDMMWLAISYVVFSIAFVSIYGGWAGGGSKISSGLNFGLLAGLMVGVGLNLTYYAVTTTMTLSHTFTDAAYTIVKFIIVGILVAYGTGIPGGSTPKTS